MHMKTTPVAALFLVGLTGCAMDPNDDREEEPIGPPSHEALSTRGSPTVQRFPVNGAHNTGWDPQAGDLRCNGSLANTAPAPAKGSKLSTASTAARIA